MNRIRDTLTVRGRAFVAAGVTLGVCGLALGFADITRIGVLLASLPLLAALVARRRPPQLEVSRTVHPSRLALDQGATVEVQLENTGTRPSPLVLAEERVDPVLGARPRFVLPRMQPRERRRVTYPVRSHVRGRHHVGPLGLRLRDPFGLAVVTTTVPGSAEVVVLPRVEALGGGRPRGEGIGAEGVIPHMVALHGEDDVAIREYRDGDDLRHIHWPATAHQGELMVRQEDRPARRRAVVVLDSRRSGHRGSGTTASFEWAVSAAASVVRHLTGHGYAVHLVSSESVTEGRAADMVELDAALEQLAVADLGADDDFDGVLHAAYPLTSSGGLVIAVVTDHDEDLVRQVATLRQPGGTGLLLLVEAASFVGGRQLPGAAARTAALADVVRAAGWSTCTVRAGTTVAGAWTQVAGGSGMALGVAR